jgi:hypothetical protein
VRFDVNTIGNRLDQPDTFGVYTNTADQSACNTTGFACGILGIGPTENDEGLVRVGNDRAKFFV